jgi:hypothetical protein
MLKSLSIAGNGSILDLITAQSLSQLHFIIFLNISTDMSRTACLVFLFQALDTLRGNNLALKCMSSLQNKAFLNLSLSLFFLISFKCMSTFK